MKKNTLFKTLLLLVIFAGSVACSDDDKKSGREAIEFAVTPETIQFNAIGGNSIINIHVNGNDDWTIENSTDWLTISETAGKGVGHAGLVVAANETTDERTATITVTSGTETRPVTIRQSGDTSTIIVYDIAPDATNMSDMTSVQLTADMGTGWNLGNTLEAIGGETAWGNPMANRQLIDGVKAAGFNTIRIPVSWSNFSDEANFTINPTWINRVQQVVDYAIANDMYVIMNEHWDNGWMQPTYAQQTYVNNRLAKMWKQIATHFRDYDYHLIFAGSNEVMVTDNYGTPTAEYYTVQNSFNQTFITAVRTTGGRNAFRYLAVQGFNTNIDHTVNFAVIPEDVTPTRLLMEVHFYDPFNFTLVDANTITQWGTNATDPASTETWANEAYVDTQFQRMKTNFIDRGVGVILGEYGAISRTDVAGHEAFRTYWIEYVSTSARNYGLVPVWWDAGLPQNNHTMGLFDRNTGAVAHQNIVDAILP
ncbi:glycosyl hydrolase family 5 [Flavobacterium rivuli WB 3.3-2 = DSM 21788]|uniref:Glycosyl hydrolase family 5 n=1 Tax=Flavobacterium rivuli WB 3.3-2 = DSM 21788 TaxID=1121895 RepID=A0A0A2M2L7_9FLAO|nr:cellulase family glycosylhydrolase [Flavobacterium rivuli]KGO85861.1 glycosyl hydrolase family 5 [Flavobacterium rivuli WB 3.3-2 = DSM 21788]